MKIRQIALVTAMAVVLMAGCGQQEKTEPTESEVIILEGTEEETKETEKAEETADSAEDESENAAKEPAETGTAAQEGEQSGETAENTSDGSGEGYEDNFAVDSQAAADFARQIKEAVAEKDLEKLADLTAFPVYVSFTEEGGVEDKEAFLSLDADQVFSPELTAAVAAADEDSLAPSMAGFVLSDENGKPNIIFGVVDGKLGITGMNY